MRKFFLMCVILSSISLANADTIPCPNLLTVKAVGWSGAREDSHQLKKWTVFQFSNYYHTPVLWSFLITELTVEKYQNVFSAANAALNKLTLYVGPEETEKKELMCVYTGPNALLGMAISPPRQG